jgi:pimeloyl-ACP methyl ester carboxylesterase
MSAKALKILALAYGRYFNFIAIFSKRKAAIKAFELFCTPRKGKLQAHQKDYLNQFDKEMVSVAAHHIQTYHWNENEGPTVLLCHGWESNAFRWRNLIEKLQAKGFHIISFDAPGHGASSGAHLHVPIYEACTSELIKKYQPKYVIGHSIGGLALLYSQYKSPQTSVEKVVSLGAPSDLEDIMNNYQKLVGFNGRVLEGLDRYFRERFSFGIAEFSMAQLIKSVDKKGLIVHDLEDRIAPYQAAVDIHKNWTNAALITTEGLGHSLHQDQVNDQIISFLEAS